MDFYRNISYYYDYIFPFQEVTFEFLVDSFKLVKSDINNESRILDIACGSGSYALGLALYGDKVMGTDLDSLMIQQANAKNNKSNMEFKVHNMLDLNELDNSNIGFDFIYCIGNSIVHLDSMSEINTVIKDVYKLLKTEGVFVVQIINFDRILKDQIKELPTIYNEDEGITFKRNYIHNLSEYKIEFSTILDVETERMTERFVQSVKLYPLKAEELYSSLELAGFRNVELFGGFNGSPYKKETSYPLIVRAIK